jgi:nucleotide-binding universal stress UspA family protein
MDIEVDCLQQQKEDIMTSNLAGFEPEPTTPAAEHSYDDRTRLPSLARILLCTDFSLASETATTVAIDLARHTGATMCVLHICEYGLYSPPTEVEAAYVAESMARQERNLANVVERISGEGIAVSAVTETGHPPISIVEFIASHRPDLAIVGTNGFGGLDRMIFGSTAEAVFRRASCPVLIVGPRVSAERENRNGPVVYATDFHEPARQAAEYAAALAHAQSLPLHCVHVLPYMVEDDGDQGVVASIMKEALRQVAKKARISDSAVSYNLLYDSEVSHGVVDYAKAHRAAFIVLGVRHGPVLSSHLPPHLTYRMIATAPCPVLTVSPEAARRASGSSEAAVSNVKI